LPLMSIMKKPQITQICADCGQIFYSGNSVASRLCVNFFGYSGFCEVDITFRGDPCGRP
jgi:hypothetical protein